MPSLRFLPRPTRWRCYFCVKMTSLDSGHALKLRLRRSMSKNQSAPINLKFGMGKFFTTPDTMVMLFLCENDVIRLGPRPKVTSAALDVQE